MRFGFACAALLCLNSLLVFVTSECPNGCSGNGDCLAKDMCKCYKNFQGNDCADRTCLFAYAHVDTPRGDLNMDQVVGTVPVPTLGWLLQNSQQSPAGTYEYFNPAALANEAHFYLECANKGICDRATGLCTCFDGYEGSGCQRTVCANKCSGRGTCESIAELADKAGGTLVGQTTPMGQTTYNLWDHHSRYGCRCDPWFHGPDCSMRHCKVGVDPLFLSAGTAVYETFVVHAFSDSGATLTSASYIRLRMFDYWGESYITDRIPVVDGDSEANAAVVETAIANVPSQVFKNVNCEPMDGSGASASNVLDGIVSKRVAGTKGFSVVCQLSGNPGVIRIPEIAASYIEGTTPKAFVVNTIMRGEDDEWFRTTTPSLTLTNTAALGTNPTKLQATVTGTQTVALAIPTTPVMVKVNAYKLIVTATTASDVTLAYEFHQQLGSAESLMTGAVGVSAAIAVKAAVDFNPGDIDLQSDETTPLTTAINAGSWIYFQNQMFYVRKRTVDGTTATTYHYLLDRPFAGLAATGLKWAATTSADVYIITPPTDASTVYNYVSECSGRGLCASDTGLCTCFKGYTDDDCHRQNILAV